MSDSNEPRNTVTTCWGDSGAAYGPGDLITITAPDPAAPWWKRLLCKLLRRPAPQRTITARFVMHAGGSGTAFDFERTDPPR